MEHEYIGKLLRVFSVFHVLLHFDLLHDDSHPKRNHLGAFVSAFLLN